MLCDSEKTKLVKVKWKTKFFKLSDDAYIWLNEKKGFQKNLSCLRKHLMDAFNDKI